MIENEMANIKERLAKYIKYILIVSIVIFVIALVSVLYAHSREIMTAFGVPLSKTVKIDGEYQVIPINAGYYETFSNVLKNIYAQGHFGMVSGLSEAQAEEAKAFATNNIPVLVDMFKTFTIIGVIIALVPLAGSILFLVGKAKENNKLTKIAGFVTVGSFVAMAAFLLVYIILLINKGFILSGANIAFLIAAIALVIGTLIALAGMFLRLFAPTVSIQKVKKVVHYISAGFAGVSIGAVVAGFIIQLAFIRETIAACLSTVDLFFIIATFCVAFGLFGYDFLINNLMPLEINSEDNDLYHNLKQMATENVARKEAKNRKKALAQ